MGTPSGVLADTVLRNVISWVLARPSISGCCSEFARRRGLVCALASTPLQSRYDAQTRRIIMRIFYQTDANPQQIPPTERISLHTYYQNGSPEGSTKSTLDDPLGNRLKTVSTTQRTPDTRCPFPSPPLPLGGSRTREAPGRSGKKGSKQEAPHQEGCFQA